MRARGNLLRFLSLLLAFCLLCGCAGPEGSVRNEVPPKMPSHLPLEEAVRPDGPAAEPSAPIEPKNSEVIEPEADEPTPEAAEPEPPSRGLVVIDPGHQLHGDPTPEPIGPGAQEEKARVSSGTRGSFTGLAEHELNLTVALLLREELIARGYEVYLTREEADVNLSNSERADFANALGADAFVRIHANGSEDPARHGAMTICPTPENPYCPDIYVQSRALSDAVLDAFCAATGAQKESVWETDTMSGINYCRVPVTILEMGYMTNQEEDTLLADPAYQQLAAMGIADGIDAFLGGYHEE